MVGLGFRGEDARTEGSEEASKRTRARYSSPDAGGTPGLGLVG